MERCLICHRRLRDAESISRRIGPTCFKRLQKVTDQEKQKKRQQREVLKQKASIVKNQINVFEILDDPSQEESI
jgi:hypothetical protein